LTLNGPSLFVVAMAIVFQVMLGILNFMAQESSFGRLVPSDRDSFRGLGFVGMVLWRVGLLLLFLWGFVYLDSLRDSWNWIQTLQEGVYLFGGVYLVCYASWCLINHLKFAPPNPIQHRIKVFVHIILSNLFFALEAILGAYAMLNDITWAALVVGAGLLIHLGLWKIPIWYWVKQGEFRILAQVFTLFVGLAMAGRGLGFWQDLTPLWSVLLFGIALEWAQSRRRKHLLLQQNLQEFK
jgi:hypothetical protein